MVAMMAQNLVVMRAAMMGERKVVRMELMKVV